ncbi:MAG TPA: MMPL family transporter [Streptosporangiaceae bacterium]|nr:MMPL family transporter [Streptosporangiaceae bacterium]
MPILMLATISGLSMDYEVFLLSKVRERYDMTGSNAEAVASGLQRTGGVIASAAMLLVPATMRLLGRANWWAPRPLRGLYARYGFRETDGDRPCRNSGKLGSVTADHPEHFGDLT